MQDILNSSQAARVIGCGPQRSVNELSEVSGRLGL